MSERWCAKANGRGTISMLAVSKGRKCVDSESQTIARTTMDRTMTQAFIFILLVFGSSSPEPQKAAARGSRRSPTEGRTTSQPSSPSSSLDSVGGPHRNFTSTRKGCHFLASDRPSQTLSRPRGRLFRYRGSGATLYTMYRKPATFWQFGKSTRKW
jgi:hypothetical protein